MPGRIIFKNRKLSFNESYKKNLVSNNSEEVQPALGKTLSLKYRVATCQSTGKERPHNEDSVFTLNTNFGGLEESVNFGIYLVADGMGGHQGGELASKLAALGSSQYLMDCVGNAVLLDGEFFSQDDVKKWLIEAVDEAQRLILERVPGGGSTLTLVLAINDDLYFVHVGDSRLYVAELDGNLTLKTRDHSLVKRLIELGQISENEADMFPQKNILYRALGQSDPFEADTGSFLIQAGERLLLCSDGLWGVIKHDTINKLMHLPDDLAKIASELVLRANDAGGPDNISVVLVERVE